MSEQPARPERQQERWVKYGANVALTVVLVIAVAFVVTYIAQGHDRRFDTTIGGAYSLKPQTVNLIGSLKAPIKIVSLYSKPQPQSAGAANDVVQPVDRAQTVADLLDEYQAKSKNITTEAIDPLTEKDKLEDLRADFVKRYGGEIANYKKFIEGYDKQYQQLLKLLTSEATAVSNLPVDRLADDDESQFIGNVIATIQDTPKTLERNKESADRALKEKYPDYKAITTSLQQALQLISERAAKIQEAFVKDKFNPQIPQEIRNYMLDSTPRLAEIKKQADAAAAPIAKLGTLKVDELQKALEVPSPILVLGDNEWRIISEAQVWPVNADIKSISANGQVRPRFAGEQQITTAIISLTSSVKPKVVFLRPGGTPLTNPGFPPFQAGGPMADFADALRQYNFEVLEKDLSGQYAMQAQMQGMPAPPEPSDADIKDAVWIVLDFPSGGGQSPPAPIAPKLAEHLKQGGSALVLVAPQADALDPALKEWGVEVHPEALAVHELVKATENATPDPLEEALRQPFLWDIKNYGDAAFTKPLKNLDSLIFPIVVVKSHEERGYRKNDLLPLPDAPEAPRSWGETDITSIEQGNPPTFNPDKGDMPGPLFGGAAVEKEGGGRLVVIGSLAFPFTRYVNIPEPNLARRGVFVPRFPGNLELATNSTFWLAKLDTLIAISPSAMEVSRLADMSPSTLAFWRIGVLLIGLPAAVVLLGIFVYTGRRA